MQLLEWVVLMKCERIRRMRTTMYALRVGRKVGNWEHDPVVTPFTTFDYFAAVDGQHENGEGGEWYQAHPHQLEEGEVYWPMRT
jgi:hypothetical protein